MSRERGFSVFNEIKEDFRSISQDEDLEAVMRITPKSYAHGSHHAGFQNTDQIGATLGEQGTEVIGL